MNGCPVPSLTLIQEEMNLGEFDPTTQAIHATYSGKVKLSHMVGAEFSVSLQVVERSNAGEYALIAKNEHGECKETFDVKVLGI